jgi:hypothetical protein
VTEDPRRTIRKLNLVGLAITVLLVGGVGGWAATTQLAGAVIAPQYHRGRIGVKVSTRPAAWSEDSVRGGRSKPARSRCGSTIP